MEGGDPKTAFELQARLFVMKGILNEESFKNRDNGEQNYSQIIQTMDERAKCFVEMAASSRFGMELWEEEIYMGKEDYERMIW